MSLTKPVIAFGFLVCACAQASSIPADALPCASANLATYIAAGATGCTVGPLAFRNFEFSVVSSGGGAIPIGTMDVNVTPLPVPEPGLDFASSGFSVTGSQFAQYLLTYTIDPGPPIIDGDALDLFTQTPTFPGLASITSMKCTGSSFSGIDCPGTLITQNVFHNGTTFSLMDIRTFAPTDIVGVRTTIDLQANGANANFTSFSDSAHTTPEPASAILVFAAIALGLLSGRKRLFVR
jgi:hypothetical protein